MCMGLDAYVWVSFHVYGSLFMCMGLMSCVWVSFHVQISFHVNGYLLQVSFQKHWSLLTLIFCQHPQNSCVWVSFHVWRSIFMRMGLYCRSLSKVVSLLSHVFSLLWHVLTPEEPCHRVFFCHVYGSLFRCMGRLRLVGSLKVQVSLENIGLFCKFKEPSNRSHPICFFLQRYRSLLTCRAFFWHVSSNMALLIWGGYD